jgi:hypothetical protein
VCIVCSNSSLTLRSAAACGRKPVRCLAPSFRVGACRRLVASSANGDNTSTCPQHHRLQYWFTSHTHSDIHKCHSVADKIHVPGLQGTLSTRTRGKSTTPVSPSGLTVCQVDPLAPNQNQAFGRGSFNCTHLSKTLYETATNFTR